MIEYMVMGESGKGAVFKSPTPKQAEWAGQRYANENGEPCCVFFYEAMDFLSVHYPIDPASRAYPLFAKRRVLVSFR